LFLAKHHATVTLANSSMASCRYANQTVINQAQYAKFQDKFCKAANILKAAYLRVASVFM